MNDIQHEKIEGLAWTKVAGAGPLARAQETGLRPRGWASRPSASPHHAQPGSCRGTAPPPFARDVMCGAGTEVRCRVEKCQKEGWGGHHCVHFVVSTPQWSHQFTFKQKSLHPPKTVPGGDTHSPPPPRAHPKNSPILPSSLKKWITCARQWTGNL